MKPYQRIPILLYHRIANDKSPASANITVLPESFDSHLKYLYDKGYRSVPLDDVFSSFDAPHSDRFEKRFVITFDDGYLDNYSTAAPIMQRYGFTATFFLTTDFLNRSHSWGKSPAFPYMSWKQAKKMAKDGFTFGSHTCSHPDLTSTRRTKVVRELDESRKKIEDELGLPVPHFSYPFGRYNETVKQCVIDAGYASACSVSRYDNDRYSIERFMVTLDDAGLVFRIKACTWGSYIRKIRKGLGLSNEA